MTDAVYDIILPSVTTQVIIGVSAHDDVGRRGEWEKNGISAAATDEIPAAFGTTRIPQRTRTVLVAYMKFHQHARVVLTLIL